MQTLMERADAEGFSKMLLCGEEDYGSRENNLDYYTEQRRREKVRLAMLRLMHDYGLEQSVREKLEQYLLSHIRGCETEETWRVVLEEYGGRPALLSVPDADRRRHEGELSAHDGGYGTGAHRDEGVSDEVSCGTAYVGGCF